MADSPRYEFMGVVMAPVVAPGTLSERILIRFVGSWAAGMKSQGFRMRDGMGINHWQAAAMPLMAIFMTLPYIGQWLFWAGFV